MRERFLCQSEADDAEEDHGHEEEFFGAFALFKNDYAEEDIEQRSQSRPHGIGYAERQSFCRNRQQSDTRTGAYRRQHGKFHVFKAVLEFHAHRKRQLKKACADQNEPHHFSSPSLSQSLRPSIPMMRTPSESILSRLAPSLRTNMLISVVPTTPMPVNTA